MRNQIATKTLMTLAVLLTGASFALGQGPAELDGVVAREPADTVRVVHWFTIGSLTENRVVQRRLRRGGWQALVDQLDDVFEWYREAGVTPRIVVHLPFGRSGEGAMDYDAYLQAQQKNLWLFRGFREAWKPLTDGDAKDRIELICYMGAIDRSPALAGYFEPREDGAVPHSASHEWLMHAIESIEPVLDVGASIAFDAVSRVAPDSPEYHFIHLIRALFEREGRGRQVYLEAVPTNDKPSWRDLPIVMTNRYWYAQQAGVIRQEERFRFDELQNELLILVLDRPEGRTHEDEPEWLPAYARQWLDLGYTCLVDVNALVEAGVSYHDLVGPDEAARDDGGGER